MDTDILAEKMKRLQTWLDEAGGGPTLEQRQYSAAPFGHAYVTIDPGAQAEAASANHNRIYLCGREAGLTEAGMERLFAQYEAEGVSRFFVWLLPGSGIDDVRAWLAERGFARNPWTRYVTLRLEKPAPSPPRTDLDIREVSAAQVAEYRSKLGELMLWRQYANTAGKPGFCHWMAFDGSEPVAISSLCVFEDIACLATTNTFEDHRGRGAQSAFIAARIRRARELGAAHIVSETLTMLTSSLGNLQRAGLREIFEKEVYGRASP